MKVYTVLLLIFGLLLSGCTIFDREPNVVIGELGTEIFLPDGSTAVITCSDQCEKKSQCGTADGSHVIMGGINAPVVDHWDMMLADKTAVIINTSQNRTVQKTGGDGAQENIYFYNVTANDDSNRSGWIAGWCVASTTQPEPAAAE